MHRLPRLRWILALALVPGVGYASTGGITGYSGKDGETCTACHDGPGSKIPKVTLSGPSMLEAGVTAQYSMKIETTAASTGMNAATTDGTLLDDPRGNTLGSNREIIHLKMAKPTAGVVTYTFSLKAPAFGGKISVYAAGNAVNDDGKSGGDETETDKLDIQIDGPPKPPPKEAGTTPTTPFPASDAGTKADAGDVPSAAAPDETTTTSESGCTIGAVPAAAPAGALVTALLGLAAFGRRRRR